MKTFLYLFMAIVIVAVGLMGLEKSVNVELMKFEINNADMQHNLGNKVLVNKDTLSIIDYNYYLETYTISNGTVIDKNDVIFIIED